MGKLHNTLVSLLAASLFITGGMIHPSQAGAIAHVSNFTINKGAHSYVIAGEKIRYDFLDDAASTTLTSSGVEYSTDNGATWIAAQMDVPAYLHTFTLPLDPKLTSAKFRLTAYFEPILGSNSISHEIIGPYQILQPSEVTDWEAKSNKDGSVLLTWSDNSNMESYYQITRSGPDGIKTFTVPETTDTMGPLTYLDKTTDKYHDTFYVYSIQPIIDKYPISPNNTPGISYLWAVTDAPFANVKVTLPSKVVTDLDKVVVKPGASDNKTDPSITRVELNSQMVGRLDDVLAKTKVNVFDGASAWALPELKQAFTLGLTTGEVLGKYQEPITREGFAGIAVKLYEALSGRKAEAAAPNPFKDTAHDNVLKANKLGITGGVSEDTFAPQATITRQEISVMLLRAVKAALPDRPLKTGGELAFTDAADIAGWAREAVRFAVSYSIMNGLDGNRMDPLGQTTREQAIVLVKRTYDAFSK